MATWQAKAAAPEVVWRLSYLGGRSERAGRLSITLGMKWALLALSGSVVGIFLIGADDLRPAHRELAESAGSAQATPTAAG